MPNVMQPAWHSTVQTQLPEPLLVEPISNHPFLTGASEEYLQAGEGSLHWDRDKCRNVRYRSGIEMCSGKENRRNVKLQMQKLNTQV
ncbi:hypothetical protein NPIL_452251 [Nephila pilipes]|uniref:Uncharacterized protein n=1 Tax=Nephila pilipes TaxID=299642 RepID=A0A8X6NPN1_NEPPI|nr:hypothetical protein NPIL_452251 [Nephila pilipes]